MSSVKDLLRGDVVDGSGTANYVSKWSDADTITNSVIYDDGTNVGINDSLGYGKLTLKTSGTFTFDSNDGDFSGVNLTLKTDNISTNEVGSGIVWIKGGTDNRKVAAITNYTYSDTDQAGLNFYVQTTPSGSSAVLSEAMRIDSSGNVGIGTSSPAVKLDVEGSGTGDTNVLSLSNFETDDSGDETVNIKFRLTRSYSTPEVLNDAAFIKVGKETSWTDTAQRKSFMSFWTRNGATEPTERMRIDASGNVNVGSSSTIQSNENTNTGVSILPAGSFLSARDSVFANVYVVKHTGFAGEMVRFVVGGNDVGSIDTTTTSTSYNTSSDYRLKENVVEMTGALDRVDALKPSRFNFIADPETTVDGFLAHEVAEVVPEAISGQKDEVDAEGNPIYQGIDQSKLVPLLVGAIQELKARIEILENK